MNTTAIGGSLQILSNANIKSYSIDKIARIFGDLVIKDNSYAVGSNPVISLNSLQKIDGSLIVLNDSKLTSLQLPVLLDICAGRRPGSAISLQATTTYTLCPNQILTGNCGMFPPSVPVTHPASPFPPCPARK